jgi:hypothetical protein
LPLVERAVGAVAGVEQGVRRPLGDDGDAPLGVLVVVVDNLREATARIVEAINQGKKVEMTAKEISTLEKDIEKLGETLTKRPEEALAKILEELRPAYYLKIYPGATVLRDAKEVKSLITKSLELTNDDFTKIFLDDLDKFDKAQLQNIAKNLGEFTEKELVSKSEK